MTAAVTPIHARRAGRAVSEGTESARRINSPRTSLTPEPLLLNPPGRLHRVDASQMSADSGVAVGACRTDMGLCYGHPACADTACSGHPGPQASATGRTRAVRPPDEPSPPMRVHGQAASLLGWVFTVLVFCLLALAVAVFGPPHDH